MMSPKRKISNRKPIPTPKVPEAAKTGILNKGGKNESTSGEAGSTADDAKHVRSSGVDVSDLKEQMVNDKLTETTITPTSNKLQPQELKRLLECEKQGQQLWREEVIPDQQNLLQVQALAQSAKEDPIDYLLRVMASKSPADLTSIGRDISVAVKTMDHIPESEPRYGSLAEGITCSLESIPTSKIEDEIKEINRRVIYTKVEIDKDVVGEDGEWEGKGIHIKCSISNIAIDANLLRLMSIQPLKLFVPEDYPNRSPSLLDQFPDEVSEDLSMKVRHQFGGRVGMFKNPMSLTEIAKAWDDCARIVMVEYAEKFGGGTFTSKYGVWGPYHY